VVSLGVVCLPTQAVSVGKMSKKAASLLLTLFLASPAISACGCGLSDPPERRNLLSESGTVAAGATAPCTVQTPDDANSVFARLSWSGNAELDLTAESIDCRCGVCELEPEPQEPNRIRLEGDMSCTAAYRFIVLGDPSVATDYQFVVDYETASCD
jgi:hypothetical protein